MELFLNLVWLFVAAGSFAWWRRRLIGVRNHRNAAALAPLLAFICALSIVFPVISVTDDLHAELAVTDDSSARRRSVSSVLNIHKSPVK